MVHTLPGRPMGKPDQMSPKRASVPVNDGYWPRYSRSRRNARSFTAGSILFGMAPSFLTQKEPARNLGRFT